MEHIHLIGIGGTGLSAIARILVEMGYGVSGSDRADSAAVRDLQKLGVVFHAGHKPGNIQGADVVVRSSAIPDDNPEVVAARAAGIPVLKRADFLGSLMDGKTGIAVAGTHGKTTTTGMISWMLTALHQDPSFICGGVLTNLGVNARLGKSPFFVIEADEYDRMFLGLKPQIEVVTNVEYDHPDCFPTPADFQQAFDQFTALLPQHGTLVISHEDAGASRLMDSARQQGKNIIAFGLKKLGHEARKTAETFASALIVNDKGGYSFTASVLGKTVKVGLQVPGRHNVANALAALSVAQVLGLPLQDAASALEQFSGTGRRFEVLGEAGGVVIINDYAHHPTEIRATLSAARDRYPGKRLWAVWQPHTYSRTQALFDDFSKSFGDADEVIVTEIFAARETNPGFSSRQVAAAIPGQARYINSLAETVDYLNKYLKTGDVLLVLSAGDADQVSAKVLAHLKEKAHV